MSTTYPEVDATQGHADPFLYPNEALELLNDEEVLEAQRIWALQVDYTDNEVEIEYRRRFGF